MNNWARFKRALGNPRLFARGLNRWYHRRGGRRTDNPRGIDVFDQDWDTLVILDACRYDMFESADRFEGTLTARESKGSSTPEWLRANFHGRDLSDTVYVTANPQLERNRSNWDVNLHRTVNVWLEEGWDEETGTVLAGTVTEAALDALETFPDKRLVIHYMQPHYPFVRAETGFDKDHLNELDSEGRAPEGENVWNQKFTGALDVPDDDLWDMYVDNLEYVLDHVEALLEDVPGKTVITSDHGNYVGERASPIPIREYGHPRGLYDDVLVRVPWLEHMNGNRRQIRAGAVEEASDIAESDALGDRLRHLGYME